MVMTLLKHRQFHFLFILLLLLLLLLFSLFVTFTAFVVVSISVVQILLLFRLLFIFCMSRFFQSLTLCQWVFYEKFATVWNKSQIYIFSTHKKRNSICIYPIWNQGMYFNLMTKNKISRLLIAILNVRVRFTLIKCNNLYQCFSKDTCVINECHIKFFFLIFSKQTKRIGYQLRSGSSVYSFLLLIIHKSFIKKQVRTHTHTHTYIYSYLLY